MHDDLRRHLSVKIVAVLQETINPPSFASSPRVLTYVCLVVFAVISLFVVNLRRSSTGMALSAVRWSEPASKTIGVSVLQMKLVVAGAATFVAGVGGALLALTLGTAPIGGLRAELALPSG